MRASGLEDDIAEAEKDYVDDYNVKDISSGPVAAAYNVKDTPSGPIAAAEKFLDRYQARFSSDPRS